MNILTKSVKSAIIEWNGLNNPERDKNEFHHKYLQKY